MSKLAAVLGAGIQGCCAALALSQLGFKVKIYDKSGALMRRASLNQEGKIHLGFVYARDPSMITARKMIEHALRFAPAVEKLVETQLDWEPHLSERFYCGIHRDSTLSLEEHFAHFRSLQKIYDEASDKPGLNYLGRRLKKIWTDETSFRFKGESMIRAVKTEETAVHTGWMRQVILRAVENRNDIDVFLHHEVNGLEKTNQSFTIHGNHAHNSWKNTADIVVNCLWEGQSRIDRSLGLDQDSDWITRIKYGFTLESIASLSDLPSLIVTHGPFGDIVNFPSDHSIYITWYPACLAYIGQTEQIPDQWEDVCEGHHNAELTSQIYRASVDALGEYVPELRTLRLKQVLAGSIMGHGKTDISDRESGLHRRHGIGVAKDGDYYSIFTGKYTSGPANAMELQQLLR